MIVTLTTDFGWEDPYVGMLKGVLLERIKNVSIVDITHGLGKFSVRAASFVFFRSYRYFPNGTYHLLVVDPGVGGKRRIIALRTRDGHTMVGPDNGVFSYFFHEDLVGSFRLFNPEKLPYPRTGNTFQARDLMAPLLSDIALGRIKLEGSSGKPTILEKPKKEFREEGIIFEVIYVDSFGNCITNLEKRDLKGDFVVEVGKSRITRILESYEEGREGEAFFIEGGFGVLEISMNMDNASKRLGIKEGDRLFLKWLS